MYRVLIADADPLRACHLEVDLEGLQMKAVSVVSGEMAVAFCREYDLDLIVLDLAMADARDALRLLRENEMTAMIPVMGISGGEGAYPLERAGLCGLVDGALPRLELAQELRKCLQKGNYLPAELELALREDALKYANSKGRTDGKPVERLLVLSERILSLAANLKSFASEFGADGPEMFEFVEKSANQMHQRLTDIAEHGSEEQASHLRDREVRHDFRNILASVRGFTDLILMEEGIPESSLAGLREICDCSNQFIECLDAEKTAAVRV